MAIAFIMLFRDMFLCFCNIMYFNKNYFQIDWQYVLVCIIIVVYVLCIVCYMYYYCYDLILACLMYRDKWKNTKFVSQQTKAYLY